MRFLCWFIHTWRSYAARSHLTDARVEDLEWSEPHGIRIQTRLEFKDELIAL